jgi:hypothetical protein
MFVAAIVKFDPGMLSAAFLFLVTLLSIKILCLGALIKQPM